jgi:hypothetical protein
VLAKTVQMAMKEARRSGVMTWAPILPQQRRSPHLVQNGATFVTTQVSQIRVRIPE